MDAADILRFSSTAAAQRTQQLFQEMESDESMFRNVVMMAESAIEDLKQEETAISQRRVVNAHQRAETIKGLSQDEAAWIDRRYQQRARQLSSRTHGLNVISDPKQWGFPNVSRTIPRLRMSGAYEPSDNLYRRLDDIISQGFVKGRPQRDNISREYLWMLDIAIR